MKRLVKPKVLKQPKGTLKSSAADAIATAVFVFVSSVFSELSDMLAKNGVPEILAGLGVLVVALIGLDTFNNTFLGEGTLNNPSNNAAFAAAGKGTFSVHFVRVAAQLVGGVAGAWAAINYIPKPWLSKIDDLAVGVKPGVSIAAGATCEFALAFLLNLAILYSMSTKYKSLGALTPLVATVILVIAGAGFTGPSMNPAHAFSWNYVLDGHDRAQHIAVFWAGPLGGALAAGLFWNWLTSPAKAKKKSAAPPKAKASAAKETPAPKEEKKTK